MPVIFIWISRIVSQPDYAPFGYQGVPARELVAQLRCVNDRNNVQSQMPIPPQLNAVLGKRVAWQEYRTSVDRATGNFAIGAPLSYWTFARFYGGIQISAPESNAALVLLCVLKVLVRLNTFIRALLVLLFLMILIIHNYV